MSASLTDYDSAPPSPSNDRPNSTSALYDALLECSKSIEATSPARIELLAEANNPRPLSDGALYWVDNKGKPLSFKFPALVDLEGQFSRLDPYFNLDGAKSVCLFKQGTFGIQLINVRQCRSIWLTYGGGVLNLSCGHYQKIWGLIIHRRPYRVL